MKRLMFIATLLVASIGLIAAFGGVARADTISPNPITFDSSQSYVPGSINGQHGWSDTGGYDAQVVATSVPGFGDQSLQISDATTSGSFGDQTFAPGLTQPASETSNPYFTASFSIDTATATPNDGLHMSVSPDNGQGGRMSYLRFEYHSGDSKVHVFFDDVSQSSLCSPKGCANFTETDIAQFAPNTVHTFTFAIVLVPGTNSGGSPNDVVKIYEDSSTTPLITGTTWEGYYRYDPESGPTTPPAISTLLFREGGNANPADLGNGYLIDNMSMSSSTLACTPTGLMRDNINLTAALVNPGTVNGTVNATGCNIGVYYGFGHSGTVSGANISGANYYGVVADGAAVNVTGSNVHDIGDVPLNGSQHGNAIYYTNAASGTISGNTVGHYQKNGITAVNGSSVMISGNTVTGEGPVDYIAQNGIEVGSGATGTVQDNTVTGNAYTGPNGASSGGVLVFGGPVYGVPYTTGVQIVHNTLTNNDVGIYLYNADGNGNAPKTQTKNNASNNTITNNLDSGNSNKTGCTSTMGYQVGVSDFGTKDSIVNNKISGTGYTPARVTPVCTGTAPTWKAPIDTSGVQKVHLKNNK